MRLYHGEKEEKQPRASSSYSQNHHHTTPIHISHITHNAPPQRRPLLLLLLHSLRFTVFPTEQCDELNHLTTQNQGTPSSSDTFYNTLPLSILPSFIPSRLRLYSTLQLITLP